MRTELWFLAWRNIWRQKRRTTLTLLAIALGLGSLIFVDNLVKGMRKRLIQVGTGSLVGHAQIHAPGYLTSGDPAIFMQAVDAQLKRARAHPQVIAASPRIFGPVLAAIGSRSASLTLMGVEPENESNISNWRERIAKGTWFENERQVLIGAGLAEKLEVEPESKLVLTASTIVDGELNSVLVHVAGILATEDAELDSFMIIAPRALAEQLLGLEDAAQEIVLKLDADLLDQAGLEAILAQIATPGVEAIPWQMRMVPLLKGMEIQNVFLMGTFFVVCLLAGLGIANTMGMSLLERVREFGVLQAIGTGPFEMGTMVIMEYIFLGFLGALAGYVLGYGLSLFAHTVGIPMGHVEVVGMVLSDPLYPVVQWRQPLLYALGFFAMVPTLAVIPMRKILARDPASALRFNG